MIFSFCNSGKARLIFSLGFHWNNWPSDLNRISMIWRKEEQTYSWFRDAVWAGPSPSQHAAWNRSRPNDFWATTGHAPSLCPSMPAFSSPAWPAQGWSTDCWRVPNVCGPGVLLPHFWQDTQLLLWKIRPIAEYEASTCLHFIQIAIILEYKYFFSNFDHPSHVIPSTAAKLSRTVHR